MLPRIFQNNQKRWPLLSFITKRFILKANLSSVLQVYTKNYTFSLSESVHNEWAQTCRFCQVDFLEDHDIIIRDGIQGLVIVTEHMCDALQVLNVFKLDFNPYFFFGGTRFFKIDNSQISNPKNDILYIIMIRLTLLVISPGLKLLPSCLQQKLFKIFLI